MGRRALMGAALILTIIVSGAALRSTNRGIQVVGTLPPDDLSEILRLVRKDLRTRLLPSTEWDSLFYPRYIITSIMDYEAQRILWVQAHEDGHVEVYAGVDKAAIHDEGHNWQLRKGHEWAITGYGYWGCSNVAGEINVPLP